MTRIVVDDPGALAREWRRFAGESDKVMETAFRDALTTTGLLEDVWNRTPKSLMQRYAAQYKGIDIKGVNKNGSVRMTRGWADKLSEKQLARVQQYGHERLANSIMPGGPDYRNLRTRREGRSFSVIFSSSLPYARAMHEARKPAEGNYWTPGKRSGWSAKMSGNKFLEKPLTEGNGKLAGELAYQLEREMHNRGLM